MRRAGIPASVVPGFRGGLVFDMAPTAEPSANLAPGRMRLPELAQVWRLKSLMPSALLANLCTVDCLSSARSSLHLMWRDQHNENSADASRPKLRRHRVLGGFLPAASTHLPSERSARVWHFQKQIRQDSCTVKIPYRTREWPELIQRSDEQVVRFAVMR
jgi:hypothetical protein